MTVDLYAICPCGSGKKIKFCKCKDSVSELDLVLKMVEGGQVVPALDRLSTILQEHPDAAWALAVRGRLLLDLREYDSLSENAERFIRLQPSNPLALTQRAAAKLFAGDLEEATGSMLEALTESGRDVDTFVLDVSSVLAYSLAQGGMFLTARVYATLSMMASGYEGGRTAMTVLQQMNSAPTINQLLKAIPATIERPLDADWGERYDEATTLLRSNKVLLAENKFQSLQRTHANEPAVLSGLLTCAIWRGDAEAQSALLKKLSGCESLDFTQRTRFLAMSALVEPGMPKVAVEIKKLTADIEDVDQVEMAMAADSRFFALPSEMLGQMRESEDDVPPRAGFQLLDRDKPESIESLPPVDEIPEAESLVLVFGKQTDRAARIEALDVRTKDLDDVRSRLASVIDGAELKEEAAEPLPLLVACQPPIAMIRFKGKPGEAQASQLELMERRMPEKIVTAELELLGGKSLQDLVADDSKRLERSAVVQVIQQYDAIVGKAQGVVSKVNELAQLEPLPTIKPDKEAIETIDNADLDRVDPSDLDVESLIYLLQRAQQISASVAEQKFANRLLESEMTEEQQPAKLVAYMSLINSAGSADKALAYLDEAKKFAATTGVSDASLLLSEVSLRLQSGDRDGFQTAMQTLSEKHGNDPEVMAQLQQMLISMGLLRPDGSPRTAPSPAGPPAAGGGEGSGLWTPDSGPADAPASSEGGGKLWVPGMD
tara:strand:+ start:46794 stop:48947 length:2154 start_codon:yes stop_codon:yes gene_type:complete